MYFEDWKQRVTLLSFHGTWSLPWFSAFNVSGLHSSGSSSLWAAMLGTNCILRHMQKHEDGKVFATRLTNLGMGNPRRAVAIAAFAAFAFFRSDLGEITKIYGNRHRNGIGSGMVWVSDVGWCRSSVFLSPSPTPEACGDIWIISAAKWNSLRSKGWSAMSGFCQTRSMWPERALFKRKQYPFISILYLFFRNKDTITLKRQNGQTLLFQWRFQGRSLCLRDSSCISGWWFRWFIKNTSHDIPPKPLCQFYLVEYMVTTEIFLVIYLTGFSRFSDQVSKKWCLKFKLFFFCSHAMRKLGWTRSTNLPFRRDWLCVGRGSLEMCSLDVARLVWRLRVPLLWTMSRPRWCQCTRKRIGSLCTRLKHVETIEQKRKMRPENTKSLQPLSHFKPDRAEGMFDTPLMPYPWQARQDSICSYKCASLRAAEVFLHPFWNVLLGTCFLSLSMLSLIFWHCLQALQFAIKKHPTMTSTARRKATDGSTT